MRRHLIVLCALLTAACQQKSPEEKLVKDVEPAISWAAALQFTAEKWLANSAPKAFVRATAAAGEKEFDKAKKSVSQSKADRKLRDAIGAQIELSDRAASDLEQAVERGDRRAVGQLVSRFASAHQALDQIQQQAGGE